MRTIMKLNYIGLVLMTLVVSACAVTDQKSDDVRTHPKMHVFSVHDLDEDGLLSKTEYQRLIEHRERRCESSGHRCRPFYP